MDRESGQFLARFSFVFSSLEGVRWGAGTDEMTGNVAEQWERSWTNRKNYTHSCTDRPVSSGAGSSPGFNEEPLTLFQKKW